MGRNFKFILILLMLGAANVSVLKAQHDPLIMKVPVFRKDTLNILSRGAVADGQTLNTRIINAAIDEQHTKGGGVVLIPKGLWSSGPIELKSNVNLHLAAGALLVFSGDFGQYKLVEGNWEGLPQMRNQSPISATGQNNIAITGKGIIDGNGTAWRQVKKEKLTDGQWTKLISGGGIMSEDSKTWFPSSSSYKGSREKNPGVISKEKTAAYYASVKDFLRPNMILFTRCRNILLEGVTFQQSPAWCLHPLMCENLTVRGVTVKNPWYAQNGDGIDVESCTNVVIENSTFDVGDDALCMKSGRDEAGRKRAMPTQKVTIRNCNVYSAHGGFVVGSEMSGGVRDIVVEHCSFIGTDIGLRFKSARGRGGVVENIKIRNIQMKDIPGEAILFDMFYMAKDPVPANGQELEMPVIEREPLDEGTPVFRNIQISDVQCDGAAKAIFVRGLPEMPLRDISMSNISIKAKRGIELQEADRINLKNIDLTIQDPTKPILFAQTSNISIDQVRTYAHDTRPLSQLVSQTAMRLWPDSFKLASDKQIKWHYDQGVILKGMEEVWKATGDRDWFSYIQKSMDFYVSEDGNIKAYKKSDYNIDNVNNGKVLLMLYKVTGKEKYLKAVNMLREQMLSHPRTNEGGYWHKQIYPSQMWLDGLYMAQPFLAEYAVTFHEDTLLNDVVRQFRLMEKNARDAKTGLLYHGWDESRQQKWANLATGTSPHFWGRSLGWFGMALVDAIEYFPKEHPGYKELKDMLARFVEAILKVQDHQTGLWYDIVDKKEVRPNYPEASASAMLTYTLAKGVRLGLLPSAYVSHAQKAYQGIRKHFILDSAGYVNLKGTVTVSGLGGTPYRDGSFSYYMSEPVIHNDPKGLGAFILCATEMEKQETIGLAAGKKVVLDNYFNNEWRKDVTGANQRWHYVWDERDNGGYSFWEGIFNKYGSKTELLSQKPQSSSLLGKDVFIIVDPDTDRETASPNYVSADDVAVIKDWVNKGGTLVLLANDSINAEFPHFNTLAGAFGIRFEQVLVNPVIKDDFPMGVVMTDDGNPVFGDSKKLFIKELSTLVLSENAKPLVVKDGKVIMATVQYGKGRVFALGDPWIYNEYIDGRKLPKAYRNFDAAEMLVKWLLNIDENGK